PAAQRHDGFDQFARTAVGGDVVDEAAIDLEAVERQRAELRQAGIAGAEIVKTDADAVVLERGDDRADRAEVLVQTAFGNLDLEAGRREPGFGEHLEQLLSEPRVAELDG